MIEQATNALAQPIVYLPEPLHMDWFSPSPFASLLAQALNEWCEGDIAMVNAGVLLASLPKGVVTKGDIHRICPHPINPCKVYLRGSELKEVILQAETEQMKQLRVRGFGFRGEVMGQMVYDGVTIEKETMSDGQEHVRRIFIHHQPIDEQKRMRSQQLICLRSDTYILKYIVRKSNITCPKCCGMCLHGS